MAHDDTFQPDPDRSPDDRVQTAHIPSARSAGSPTGDPPPTDEAVAHGANPSAVGTSGVVLGASGLPDRETLQESDDIGTANVGAALQPDTGLGATRGDDRSFRHLPGEISGVGGTRGTGAGTGQSPTSTA